MKKILSLALSLALVLSVATVVGISAQAEETKTVILDWSDFNGYSGGNFTFTKDDPTGYIHVKGSKELSTETEIADLVNWWNWSPEGYDKIQFTAYGKGNIRISYGGYEPATTPLSNEPTVITIDVSSFPKTDKGDIKFQTSGEKGSTVTVDLYISDVYGIKASSSGGEETPTYSLPTIEMLTDGAALRIDGKTEGIRFDATVNTAELSNYIKNVDDIEEKGMLIAKEGVELSDMTLDKAKASDKPDTVVDTNVVKAVYADGVDLGEYDDTRNIIIGSLVEISEEHTTQNYVARAFIKFKSGDIAYASNLSEARSVAYVAYKYKNDTNSSYNNLCENHKNLIDGWANQYKTEPTETSEIILDWTNFNGSSAGGFSFTKDDPTGYIHVTGTKKLGSSTQIADLLNWWNWTAAGYDKIQFTAYTASDSCDIRMVYGDNVETANTTISTTPTVVTYDVTSTASGDVKFQLDAGEKGATVSVDLYISDVYGIKAN